MGEALAAGVLAAGIPPSRVRAADPDPARRKQLEQSLAIEASADNASVVAASDLVVLAVKPGLVVPALVALGGAAASALSRPLWVSIAAGVPLAALSKALPPGARVVRAMPNTPALVRGGATAFVAAEGCDARDRALARALFEGVGIGLGGAGGGTARRRHRSLGQRASLRLRVPRGALGRRGAHGAPARSGQRARGADRARLRPPRAGDGAAPRDPQGPGHLPGRHHHRGARAARGAGLPSGRARGRRRRHAPLEGAGGGARAADRCLKAPPGT